MSVAQPLTFRVVWHSDLHFARNEWGFTQFPAVPGHEIVGSVVMTYGSMDKHLNTPTYGGYSQGIVVTEEFVLRIPPNLNLAAAAPLLCAGITTYSPLRRWKVGTGQKVGIIGLGGLGHMAVKFAHAFGAHVVRRLDPDETRGEWSLAVGSGQAEQWEHAFARPWLLLVSASVL